MSLWLCLRFDQLPLQCLNRSEQQPVVVMSRQRVLRTNECAAALGIRQGMSTSTVHALANDEAVLFLERDTDAEQRCLHQLCCWAYSITPTLFPFREDCLQLEIGGSLTLFKGLDALMNRVKSGTGSRGYRVQAGLAATPDAAWLLSFTDAQQAVEIQEDLRTRLAPLPLNLLDQHRKVTDSLRRAGLHTLGDILDMPLQALGRRCGTDFTRYLQQVLGERDGRQPDYQPPPKFSDEYWFGYDVKANAELMPAIQLLLQSLCRFLRNTQLQTGEIHWQLIGLDGKLRRVTVRSSTRHSLWENWYQLTCIRFEQLQLDESVEGIALECNALATGELENIDLFSPHNQREPLGALLDRLRNRLGLQAVQYIGCRDEHLPELALHLSHSQPGAHGQPGLPAAQRPFWLMPLPQTLPEREGQLYWNGKLELVYGPERIEDNWWREPASRDYYIARGRAGQHYWIFRDRLASGWFIHGLFS